MFVEVGLGREAVHFLILQPLMQCVSGVRITFHLLYQMRGGTTQYKHRTRMDLHDAHRMLPFEGGQHPGHCHPT